DIDRNRRGRERHREYEPFGPEADRFGRYDRESFAREDGFRRGSRDYSGGRGYHGYGRDRDSMGRREEPGRGWDSDYYR
ncbi:hypothetical protein ABTJ30_19230, partial [Acinetobacter baumannii]